MTLSELLGMINIQDQTMQARFPDGSGVEDRFIFSIFMDGHGKPGEAEVNRIFISRGSMGIATKARREA